MAVESTTERINRHMLVRLLDTMASFERQAITHRTPISSIEAALASTTESPPPNRRYSRPASHVAAMLPAVKPVRSPRPTLVGARCLTPEPTIAEPVAPPPIAKPIEVEQAEPPVVELSAQVVAQLTAEEIAMLPTRLRPVALPLPPIEEMPRIAPASPRPSGRWLALMLAVCLVMLFVLVAQGRF